NMNELQIIRSQLAVEQAHAADVTQACAAVFGSAESASAEPVPPSEGTALFREACVSYLVWVLARFEERDQTLSELLASRQPAATAAAASARQLMSLIGRSGTSREALSRLETALAEHLSVADWRRVCAIDADFILDERNRFARVTAQLPPGIELRRPPS